MNLKYSYLLWIARYVSANSHQGINEESWINVICQDGKNEKNTT